MVCLAPMRLCDLPIRKIIGLVVKASASKAEDRRFDSRLSSGEFSGSSHTSDLNIGSGYPARRLAV